MNAERGFLLIRVHLRLSLYLPFFSSCLGFVGFPCQNICPKVTGGTISTTALQMQQLAKTLTAHGQVEKGTTDLRYSRL